MSDGTRLLSARSVRVLDIGVIVWIVVWLVLGVVIWHDIDAQTSLSTNVIKVGAAVRQTGEALSIVGGLPLVGGGIGDFADRISKVGADVESSGQDSRDGITRIAVIAGIGVGILPAALVLLVYLPLRLGWRRDVRGLKAALPASSGQPGFERYLAQRAAGVLPWDRLSAISDDPWRDIEAGHVGDLADAELARLGLERPPLS